MSNQKRFSNIDNTRNRVAHKVIPLCQLQSRKSLLAILSTWIIITISCLISETLKTPSIYILSIFIIASRQHSLYVLMHEGTHFRLSPSKKWNDYLSDYLVAYPIFFKTSLYRERHFLHHQHLNTDMDPDWKVQSNCSDWQFPMNKKVFFREYRKYLWGHGIKEMLSTWKLFSGLSIRGTNNSYGPIFFYATLAFTLYITNSWWLFIKYWLIPALTVLPFILRLRNVAEHFGLKNTNTLNSSRNTACPIWERFFIAPLNVSYHLDHHLFPEVPFYNLPKLHTILLKDKIYQEQSHYNSSYLGNQSSSLLKDLIKSP